MVSARVRDVRSSITDTFFRAHKHFGVVFCDSFRYFVYATTGSTVDGNTGSSIFRDGCC